MMRRLHSTLARSSIQHRVSIPATQQPPTIYRPPQYHKSTESITAKLRCPWVNTLKSSALLLLTEAMKQEGTSRYTIKSITKQSVDTNGRCTTTCVYSSTVKISFSITSGLNGCSWKQQGCHCKASRGSAPLNCEASGLLKKKDDKTFENLVVRCQKPAIKLAPEAAKVVTVEEKFDVTTATAPVTTVTTSTLATETSDIDASGQYEGSGQHADVTNDDVIIHPVPIINDVIGKLQDDDLILIN